MSVMVPCAQEELAFPGVAGREAEEAYDRLVWWVMAPVPGIEKAALCGMDDEQLTAEIVRCHANRQCGVSIPGLGLAQYRGTLSCKNPAVECAPHGGPRRMIRGKELLERVRRVFGVNAVTLPRAGMQHRSRSGGARADSGGSRKGL
jgi:hypothetical protein